jgi:uncharacterized membrane protein YfcA
METIKLLKLIIIIFLGWLVVTFIPNELLRKWYFVLFIFADFYFSAYWMKRVNKKDVFINTVILGLLILGIVSIFLRSKGF